MMSQSDICHQPQIVNSATNSQHATWLTFAGDILALAASLALRGLVIGLRGGVDSPPFFFAPLIGLSMASIADMSVPAMWVTPTSEGGDGVGDGGRNL